MDEQYEDIFFRVFLSLLIAFINSFFLIGKDLIYFGNFFFSLLKHALFVL